MAADVILNVGTGGDVVRSIDKTGVKTQVVALDLGGAGAESLLTTALPVTGTFFQGTQPVSGPLTDAQLRAVAVPISGSVTVSSAPTTAVTGPLTDAQLRAAAVPTSLAALPALVAGSANIGDVDIVTMPAVVLAAGSAAVGSVTDGGSRLAAKRTRRRDADVRRRGGLG